MTAWVHKEEAGMGRTGSDCWVQVTAKPSNLREDSELTPVLRVLQKVEFTAALETTVLRQLARFVMYESYPAGEHTVVKQGDPGALFYIILAGMSPCCTSRLLTSALPPPTACCPCMLGQQSPCHGMTHAIADIALSTSGTHHQKQQTPPLMT